MSNLIQERRALFQRARQDFEPTGNARVRNARALAARLGISAGAFAGTLSTASAGAGAVAAATKSGASLVSLSSKWLLVGLLLGGGAVSGVAVVRGGLASAPFKPAIASATHTPTRSPALRPLGLRSAPEAAVPALAIPALSARLAPVRQAEPPRSADPKAPSAPPIHPANVTEEARLICRAEEALRAGSPSAALAVLDKLAREQPNGVLMEERAVERIDGLCQLGRTLAARTEATRFLRASPSSPLAKRVQQSCAGPLTTPN